MSESNLPARKYVNGRRVFLQMVDSLLAEERNVQILREAFQVYLETSPVKFVEHVVFPLLPRDLAGLESDGDEQVRSVTVEFVPKAPKAVESQVKDPNGESNVPKRLV